MKRIIAWGVGIALTGAALAVLLSGQNRPSAMAIAEPTSKQTAPAGPAHPAQPAAGGSGEKIVYTFGDEAKMNEFETLWRRRQAAIVRMTVLQSYWNEEQAVLTGLNNKLTTDYTVDIKKNYSLDPQRRVLIEREELPPSAATPDAPVASAPPATQPSPSATDTQ